MGIWAQILNNKLHWKFSWPTDPSATFPGLTFVDITNASPMPEEGWDWNGTSFVAPPQPTTEEKWADFRRRRLAALYKSDFTMGPNWRTERATTEQVNAADAWRNALLNAPQVCATPESALNILTQKPSFLP